jgi:hypothetical protein
MNLKKLIPGLRKSTPAAVTIQLGLESSQTIMTDVSSSNETCAICANPLLVIDTDVKPNSTFLDNIELPCLHHFHWECMYRWDKNHKRGRCPICKAGTLTDGRMLVTVWDDQGDGPHAKRNVDLGVRLI